MPTPLTTDRMLASPPGPEVSVGGRRLLYFGGTGYLGIQARPELAVAADAAMRRFGLHAATSRSGFGETPPLREAEAAAAAWFGSEAAWLLPTGWAGASVLVDGFADEHERIFLDADAHYAVRDAARLSGLPIETFGHRDPDDLEARITASLRGRERPLVMTDGVFAVSGRIAPLADYARVLSCRDGASILVDDAHGFGVLGADGRGTVEHTAPRGARCLVTGTASKALGGYGGLLCGDAAFVTRLQARSRWYEGSTPPPAPVAAATAAALRIAREEPELRARLAENVRLVRTGLRSLGLPVEDLPTPAIPLARGGAKAMAELHAALRADGVLVPWLPRYSGLGPDGAMRIAVFATHRATHLEQLIDALRRHL